MIVKCSLRVEACPKAGCVDRPELHSCADAGIGQAHLFATQDHMSCAPGIPRLLSFESPYTVISRVAKFIVFTLNAMQKTWTCPHIGHEILEDSPSRIDCDAAATVMPVRASHRIRGSIDHALPTDVFRCSSNSTAMAVTNRMIHTTAGLGMAIFKFSGFNNCFIPAYAQTNPMNAQKGSRSTTKNCQAVKRLTGQIDAACFPAFIRDAATGIGGSISQTFGPDNRARSARAGALPSCFSSGSIAGPRQDREPSECLTCQTISFHKSLITHVVKGVQLWSLPGQCWQ